MGFYIKIWKLEITYKDLFNLLIVIRVTWILFREIIDFLFIPIQEFQ